MELLVTGAWKHTEDQLDKMRNMGHSVTVLSDESEDMPISYDSIEGVICNSLFLYHDIRKFTSLRYIQLTSAGLDRVPLDYIKEHSIELHNARGVYSIPMAEFVVFGVLQLYKHGKLFLNNQKQHKWGKHRGLLELYGKTVCIVGCGSVGTECAKRFRAFGCSVIGIDKYPREDVSFQKILPVEETKTILPQSDIVILTLPLDEQTRHFIGNEELAMLRNGTVVVNIARGAVVDTEALLEQLRAGRIFAVLDVFEEEPLTAEHPLWDMDNVIITPHNSFVGENNADHLFEVISINLENFVE